MKTLVRPLAILLCMAPALLFAQAADEIAKMKQDVIKSQKELLLKQKKLIVLENMELTDAELKAFLPVYDKYQADIMKINRRFGELIKTYAKNYNALSDEKASKLMTEFLDIQEARLKLKRSYVEDFSKVLPPKKLVRYYQVEQKLETIAMFELSKEIPLVK